jgi:hypothetical protein
MKLAVLPLFVGPRSLFALPSLSLTMQRCYLPCMPWKRFAHFFSFPLAHAFTGAPNIRCHTDAHAAQQNRVLHAVLGVHRLHFVQARLFEVKVVRQAARFTNAAFNLFCLSAVVELQGAR